MLDIEKIRQETPACDDILHFNNAGASLAPVEVSKALISHLQREQEIAEGLQLCRRDLLVGTHQRHERGVDGKRRWRQGDQYSFRSGLPRS